MMAGEANKKPPRILAKGARVEVAPFRRPDHVFVDLGGLDGKKGSVTSVGSGKPPRTIYVQLDGKPGAVGYPADALILIEED